jgi:hypothetical protein
MTLPAKAMSRPFSFVAEKMRSESRPFAGIVGETTAGHHTGFGPYAAAQFLSPYRPDRRLPSRSLVSSAQVPAAARLALGGVGQILLVSNHGLASSPEVDFYDIAQLVFPHLQKWWDAKGTAPNSADPVGKPEGKRIRQPSVLPPRAWLQ